jgi:hypothetical protein
MKKIFGIGALKRKKNMISFIFFFEEEESRNEEVTTSSPSPTNSSTPSLSSSRGSSREMPPHMRSLQELYEVTENLNDDLTLYCHFANCEPIGFEEVVKDEKWRNAMDEEIKAIEKNNTWELTTIPKEQKPIGVKWVFKTKKNAKGEIGRYKVRLVVKGYSQILGMIMVKFLIRYMIGANTSTQDIILLESVLSRMRYNSNL